MRLKNILLSGCVLALAGAASAAEPYTLDAAHATVGFSVRHLSVSNVKGTFPKVSGTLILDEKKVSNSSVDVTIDAASVDTNNEQRDGHLRGDDFFQVAKYPTIVFKSKKVVRSGPGYLVSGDLTMKGITKAIEIPFTMSAPVAHPMMPVTVVGVEGTVSINRRDFNILYGNSMMIGDEVKIDLQVEFTKPNSKK